MVKVWLNKAWHGHPEGRTLELGDGVADIMIRQGFGRVVTEKPAQDGAPDERGEVRRKAGRARPIVHEGGR